MSFELPAVSYSRALDVRDPGRCAETCMTLHAKPASWHLLLTLASLLHERRRAATREGTTLTTYTAAATGTCAGPTIYVSHSTRTAAVKRVATSFACSGASSIDVCTVSLDWMLKASEPKLHRLRLPPTFASAQTAKCCAESELGLKVVRSARFVTSDYPRRTTKRKYEESHAPQSDFL
jgi:hypothetical protein